MTKMKKTDRGMKVQWATAAFAVLLSGCAADGSDTNAILGGAIGGGMGAAIGQEAGGRNGAVVGGAVGGAAGAAAGSNQNATKNVPAGRADDEEGYRRHRHSDDDEGHREGERRRGEDREDD